jgi:serine protease AprX
MKLKLIALLIAGLLTGELIAQDRYVVFFTDKNNSPYSTANPLQFLSQRAIDRRTNQNIAIDQTDFPVNPSYVQGLINAGATVLNTSRWFNAAIIYTTSPAVLTAINQLPYVQTSSNVGRIRNSTLPSGKLEVNFEKPKSAIPVARQSNAASFNYGFSDNQINMIGLSSLHDQGYMGEGMLIAVLDAGFLDAPLMTCFDSLFADNRIVSTWDFVDNESDVYDDHYHGAAVLSCIASIVPDTLIGTAPHASFILLRSEDANTEFIIEEYNWSVAAEYADSAGVDVINSSLGYTTFNDASQDHTYPMMNGDLNPVTIAADMAAKKGILVVNSAGNEGSSSWNYISAPADADSILAVGAVNDAGQYANFSGNGPSYDGRVKPDVAARGANTWLYSPYSNNQPTMANGTSFSSPIMAGAVACLWQAWNSKNNMEIIQAVKRSANQFSNPDTLLGYGIPNFTLANSLLNLGEYTLPGNVTMHIFPNPWNGEGTLTVLYYAQTGEQLEIEIIDLSGRLVYNSSTTTINGAFNKLEIPARLSNGAYLINFREGNLQTTAKLIRY